MSYFGLLIELFQSYQRVLKGYCRGYSKEECSIRLIEDLEDAFQIFNFSIIPFLNYNLYSPNLNTLAQKEIVPTFIGKADLSFLKIPLVYNAEPLAVEEPMRNLNSAYGFNPKDSRYWIYSTSASKFYLPLKEGRSGLYGFSSFYDTLGNYNYGYDINEDYLFHNIQKNPQEDLECQGTQFSKSQSLYLRKFNCVYGQRFIQGDVDELEVFGFKNPGYEKDLVLFLEPRIPYKTRLSDVPLNEHEGLFYNPPSIKYGVPFTLSEQVDQENYTILDHLTGFCL